MKKVRIKNFVQMGLLHEVNRLFFHPIGMALEVTVDDDGKYVLSGIQDHRDSPDGVVFVHLDKQKMSRAKRLMDRLHRRRLNLLGFIYQKDNFTGGVERVLCDGTDQ